MVNLGNLLDKADSFAQTIMKLIEKEKLRDTIPILPVIQYSGYIPSSASYGQSTPSVVSVPLYTDKEYLESSEKIVKNRKS